VKSSSKGRPEHLTGQAERPFASVCLFCRSGRDLRWSRRVGAGYNTPAGPIRIVWKMDSEWLLDGREGTSCQFPEGSGRHRPASWLPMARTGSIHARDNQPCACCSLREHAVLPTQVKHFVKCPSVGEVGRVASAHSRERLASSCLLCESVGWLRLPGPCFVSLASSHSRFCRLRRSTCKPSNPIAPLEPRPAQLACLFVRCWESAGLRRSGSSQLVITFILVFACRRFARNPRVE
jgi:hypothetical protein